MTNVAKMTFLSELTFFPIQREVLIPAIASFYEEKKTLILSRLREQEIIVAGDGRNDSPGHSAKYCTYTSMEYQSKEIVDIITVDKREVDLKSPNLEVRGFCKLLRLLLDAGIQVKEVITDAHVQVTSAMSKLHCTTGLYNNPPTDTRIINFVRGLKIIIKLPDLQYSGIISTLTAAFFPQIFRSMPNIIRVFHFRKLFL